MSHVCVISTGEDKTAVSAPTMVMAPRMRRAAKSSPSLEHGQSIRGNASAAGLGYVPHNKALQDRHDREAHDRQREPYRPSVKKAELVEENKPGDDQPHHEQIPHATPPHRDAVETQEPS